MPDANKSCQIHTTTFEACGGMYELDFQSFPICFEDLLHISSAFSIFLNPTLWLDDQYLMFMRSCTDSPIFYTNFSSLDVQWSSILSITEQNKKLNAHLWNPEQMTIIHYPANAKWTEKMSFVAPSISD